MISMRHFLCTSLLQIKELLCFPLLPQLLWGEGSREERGWAGSHRARVANEGATGCALMATLRCHPGRSAAEGWESVHVRNDEED